MIAYLIRRLAWACITLIGVTLITFVVVYRIPADPALTLAGPTALAHPEVVQNIRHKLKLDRPASEQYVSYLGALLHGDLGESYATGQPVRTLLGHRCQVGLEVLLELAVDRLFDDVEVLLRQLDAVPRAVVEALVSTAAAVEHDADHDRLS